MNKAELINKLQDIEWEDFEVKEAKSELPKNVWETVSAFSNTAGGWLVLGVKEAKKGYEIAGIENPKKIEMDFLSAIRTKKFNRPLKAKIKRYNIGSGFHKMIDGRYSHYKVKPIVSGDVDFYKIVFPLGKEAPTKEGQVSGVSEGVKVPEKVTPNQSIILDNIRKNPNITSKELAYIIGISERKIKENISKLKGKGMIRRIGPDKGGYREAIK